MTDCIFCKIARGEIPATLVHEDEHVVAFNDLNPQAPVHVLVIPREHIATLIETEAGPGHVELLGRMQRAAIEIADKLGLSERGYRLVMNCLEEAGQSVFHIHLHLLGGRAMGWPPG